MPAICVSDMAVMTEGFNPLILCWHLGIVIGADDQPFQLEPSADDLAWGWTGAGGSVSAALNRTHRRVVSRLSSVQQARGKILALFAWRLRLSAIHAQEVCACAYTAPRRPGDLFPGDG